MTISSRIRSRVGDPLLVAHERGWPVDSEVLARAISFREQRIAQAGRIGAGWTTPTARLLAEYTDEWRAEIQALKEARWKVENPGCPS